MKGSRKHGKKGRRKHERRKEGYIEERREQWKEGKETSISLPVYVGVQIRNPVCCA